MFNRKLICKINNTNLGNPNNNNDAVNMVYVDQKVSQSSSNVDSSDYLRKDGKIPMDANFDMNNHNINNVKPAESGHQAINYTQLNNNLRNYVHESGDTMKCNFQMGDNHIYGVKLSVDQTSAAPRKYIDDDLKVKADKTSLNNYLRKDGSIPMRGDFNSGAP